MLSRVLFLLCVLAGSRRSTARPAHSLPKRTLTGRHQTGWREPASLRVASRPALGRLAQPYSLTPDHPCGILPAVNVKAYQARPAHPPPGGSP